MRDILIGVAIVLTVIIAGIFTFASSSICWPGFKISDTVGCYVCQDGRTLKYNGEDGFLPRRKAMTEHECTPVDTVPRCKSKVELRL